MLLAAPPSFVNREKPTKSCAARPLLGLAALVAVGLLAAASATEDAAGAATLFSQGTTPGEVPTLAAMVPSAIRNGGALVVPTDSDYPPFEYLAANNKTVTGVSAVLMEDVFAELGLKPKIEIVSFDSIIPGFAAKRWDISLASVNVTPARAKVVDFVTYDRGGDMFYQAAGGTLRLAGAYNSICGHTVGVLEGSTQAAAAEAASAHCTSIGKTAHILQYSTQNAVNLAVVSHRVDFASAANSLVGSLLKANGKQFAAASPSFNFTSITGWAISKSSALANPFLAGLKRLVSTGVYHTVMKEWGQQSGELTPTIVT